jgi:hypothetical protein
MTPLGNSPAFTPRDSGLKLRTDHVQRFLNGIQHQVRKYNASLFLFFVCYPISTFDTGVL